MKPVYIEIDEWGDKFYFSDKAMTIRHREDGPAIEGADGSKCWYINGRRHREDGPACEWGGGEWGGGSKSWFLNGVELSEKEFNNRTKPHEGKVIEVDGKKYKLTAV